METERWETVTRPLAQMPGMICLRLGLSSAHIPWILALDLVRTAREEMVSMRWVSPD
jgi:hypothetical protein